MKKIITIVSMLFFVLTVQAQQELDLLFPIHTEGGKVGIKTEIDLGPTNAYETVGLYGNGYLTNNMSIVFNGLGEKILGDVNFKPNISLNYKIKTDNIIFGFGLGSNIWLYQSNNSDLMLEDYSDPNFQGESKFMIGPFGEGYITHNFFTIAVKYSQRFDESFGLFGLEDETNKFDVLLKPKFWWKTENAKEENMGIELSIWAENVIKFNKENTNTGLTFFFNNHYIFAQYGLDGSYGTKVEFRINNKMGLGYLFKQITPIVQTHGVNITYYFSKKKNPTKKSGKPSPYTDPSFDKSMEKI